MQLAQHLAQRLRSCVPLRSRVLCAISGGPDSVTLAHALRSLPYSVVWAHIDHGIRKTSARDARFVHQLAKAWAIPFYAKRVNVPAYARIHGMGLEDAGRQLRYRALCEIAKKSHCSIILTGHNADDQAETVLMNFLRGAGPAGLAGIPRERSLAASIRVIRPLLDCGRRDILRYLQAHHLSYRQDPSNRSQRFTRNRIRHTLLPILEKQYPGLRQRLAATADIFREEAAFWDLKLHQEIRKTVRKNGQNITVDLARLLGYHKALGRRILRQLLTGISFQDTERIYHLALSTNGHLPVQLSGGLQVRRKGNKLHLPKRTA